MEAKKKSYTTEEVEQLFNRYNEFIAHNDPDKWQSWINKNLYKEQVLWAVKIGEPNWAEQMITNDASKIEEAKAWAEKKGFDRFRIANIDDEKPDFTKTIKKS